MTTATPMALADDDFLDHSGLSGFSGYDLPPLGIQSGQFPCPDLSPREKEVLRIWLRVDTKREVTEHLFIASSTVSTYIQRIRAKYAAVERPAKTKARLLIRALEDGIVAIDDL